MVEKKSETISRSPTTNEIFAAFITALRSDKSFDNDTVDSLEIALNSDHTISANSLEKALFHSEKDSE